MGVIFSRLTGLMRLAAVAAAIGVAESRLADSYNLANTMPNIIYELILGGLLSSVLVPVLVELFERKTPEEAWRSASNLINTAIVLLAITTVIGILAAPWIASFYASRLSGAEAALQHRAITFLLRLFIPQVIFYGIAAITTALLHAHRRFGLPMLSSVLGNVVVIGVFVVFRRVYGAVDLDASRMELLVIGLGTTAGIAFTAFSQVAFAGFLRNYHFTMSIKDPLIGRVLRLSSYVIGFVLVNHLGYLFIQWLANEQQGGFSGYIAAYTFFLVPIGLVGFSIGTALVPDMSSQALNQNWDDFKGRLTTAIRVMIFFLVPAAVGFVVLGRPLLEVSLEHGITTEGSVELVSEILTLMALGLPQVAIFSLFVRSFYSMQETRTPFIVMLAMVIVHSAINIPLFEALGVGGLALGQAIVNTVAVFVLARLLAGRIGALDGKRIGMTLVRVAVAAAVMGGVVWVAERGVRELLAAERFIDELAILSVGSIVGVALYLGLARVLRLDELEYVRRLFGLIRGRAS